VQSAWLEDETESSLEDGDGGRASDICNKLVIWDKPFVADDLASALMHARGLVSVDSEGRIV